MVKKYELPDETLQLIASLPEFRMLSQPEGTNAQFATPDGRRSDLISALRSISGPGNPGFTRYANAKNGTSLNMGAYRGANNPGVLSMKKYVAPDVVLPGGETNTVINTPVLDKLIYDDIVDDEVIDDEVIDDEVIDDEVIDDDVVDDDLVDDVIVDDIVDDTAAADTIVGGGGNDGIIDGLGPDGGTGTQIIDGTGTATVDGGTGNDTITGGGGNDGPNLESSIAAILAARLAGTGGTGGTGGGDGGSGTGGTSGLTGTGTTGGTGSTTTTGTTSGTGSTSGTGDSLRDAITAAVDGTGASIDNSSAGLDTSSASSTLGSSLTADQLASLTKPKVPNVTLEVTGNGLTLDDAGSTSQTFDFPELLEAGDLEIYNEWLKQQDTLNSGGSGNTGGGKPMFEDSWGIMEY